jgi:hypothetical protein
MRYCICTVPVVYGYTFTFSGRSGLTWENMKRIIIGEVPTATPYRYPASQLPTTVDNKGEKIGRMKTKKINM